MSAWFGTWTRGSTKAITANQKYAVKHTSSGAFTADRIGTYLTNFTGSEKIKFAIYADSSGTPGALLGVTEEVSAVGSTSALIFVWAKLATPVSISATTDYWITFLTDTGCTAQTDTSGSMRNAYYNSNTYASGFTDPFGSSTPSNDWPVTVVVADYTLLPYSNAFNPRPIETSGGNVIAAVGTGTLSFLYDRFDDVPRLISYVSWSGVFGVGGARQVSIAMDGNNDIHVVASADSDASTRDIAYNTFDLTTGWGTWETVANYSEGLPLYSGLGIAVDSSNVPHVVFQDSVKTGGSTQDNVYYMNRNGGSWGNLQQIGVRSVKTDRYSGGHIITRNSDYIEVLYHFMYVDADPAYRTYTTSWSGESAYSEWDISSLSLTLVSTTSGTVYRAYFETSASQLRENGANVGSYTGSLSASMTLVGSTRYLFYHAGSNNINLVYNSGSGWTNGGTLFSGAGNYVQSAWAYQHQPSQAAGIHLLFGSTNWTYYGYLQLATDATPSDIPAYTHGLDSTSAQQSAYTFAAVGELCHIDFEEGDFTDMPDTYLDVDGDYTVTAGSAIVGSYGSQATFNDDTNPAWRSKNITPGNLSHLRIRLYIDASALTLVSGDYFYFFWTHVNQATWTNRNTIAINVNYSATPGYVELFGEYTDDADSQWFTVQGLNNVQITDSEPHWIEVLLTRPSNSSSSDGTIDVWIDDSLQTQTTGIDNYDKFADHDWIASGIGSRNWTSASGSLYIDDIIVRDDTQYIGPAGTATSDSQYAFLWGSDDDLDNQIAYLAGWDTDLDNQWAYLQGSTDTSDNQAVYLEGKSVIPFEDSFEDQTWDAWTSVSNDPTINASAAMDGSYGVELLNTDDAHYGTLDWTNSTTQTYRVEFMLNTNNLSGSLNDQCYILKLYDGATEIGRILLWWSVTWRLQTSIKDNLTIFQNSSAIVINSGTDILVRVEWTFQDSTGHVDTWLDNTFANTKNNISSGDWYPDSVEFGLVEDITTFDSGSFYLDKFGIYDTLEQTDNQLAYLVGSLDTSDNQTAYLAGGIADSDSQTAYLAGSAIDTSDSQWAYLAGLLDDLDNQWAFTQGQDTASAQLPAYLAGGIVETDNQLAYLQGSQDDSDTSLAYLAGGVVDTDAQTAYAAGQDTDLDNQVAFLAGGVEDLDNSPAYSHGSLDDSDSTAAWLAGGIQDLDNQLAYLAGQDDAVDNQLAYTAGQSTAQDAQYAYAAGQDHTTSSNEAFLVGALHSVENSSAYTRGSSDISDNLPAFIAVDAVDSSTVLAYLAGWDTDSDFSPAYLRGSLDTTASTDAYSRGGVVVSDSQSAFIQVGVSSKIPAFIGSPGTPDSDNSPAYTAGLDTTQDNQAAYAIGSLDTSDNQIAYAHGSVDVQDNQLAYLQGKDTATDNQAAYTRGSLDDLDNSLAYLAGSLDTQDNQAVYLAGGVEDLDNQSAYLAGGIETSDNQYAWLAGGIEDLDSQWAYLQGQDTDLDNQYAYLVGSQDTSDNSPAYLIGLSTLQTDNWPAYLAGSVDTQDNQTAYLAGLDTYSGASSAYLAGSLDVTDSTEAYLTGSINTTSSTPVYVDGMGERLYPDGDIGQSGSWQREDTSTSNLYESINDWPGYNDADYVWYNDAPQDEYFEVSLSNPAYDTVGEGEVKIFYRVNRRAGGNTLTLKMELRQGAAVIASDSKVLSDDETTYIYTLTQGERDSITDWTDLRVRFTVESVT